LCNAVYVAIVQTKITDRPVSVHLDHNDTYAEFHCSAVSDDSTPVTLKWYRVEASGNEIPVRNDTLGRFRVSADSTLLSLQVPENTTNAWSKLLGLYRCRATNGYSVDVVDAKLTVEAAPVPLVTAAMPVGM